MKNKMKSALRYPKIVMFGLLTAMGVVNTFVIPAFSRLFASFHGTLPLPTRIIMGTSQFILDYWYFIIGCGYLGLAGFKHFIKTPVGIIKWGALKLKIPVAGWIIKRITLTRFAKLYSMVLEAGMTAAQGISLVGESSGDPYFTYKLRTVSGMISRGTSISGSLSQTNYFPPLMLQMIELGEESGNIDGMLIDIGDFYQRDLEFDLGRISELIEPMLIIVAGLFVLLLSLGVFLPMWNMSGAMNHN